MKAIVFGGSGFLGSHVADALTEAGYNVKIFDLKPSPYLKTEQEMVVGDILNFEEVLEAIDGCDYVYNFAGIADLDDATTKPIETVRLNIEGTINILEACRRTAIKRFIYASTIYVYSDKGGFYRCSKQASELYIEEFHIRYGLNFTILRYGTLYGPRADKRNSIYRYLLQALNDKNIIATADGEELREYIHVGDAARLTVKILEPEFKNRYLIITGHHPIKLKQLFSTIKEILSDYSIDVSYQHVTNLNHYSITPYSYIPKIGKKLTTNCYTDIGQGLLECIHEIDAEKFSAINI
ncbi:GDP-L-fucose synthase [uncultured archaeon]|nr:GDP-L-fucose synthase [uncultured archaeon]